MICFQQVHGNDLEKNPSKFCGFLFSGTKATGFVSHFSFPACLACLLPRISRTKLRAWETPLFAVAPSQGAGTAASGAAASGAALWRRRDPGGSDGSRWQPEEWPRQKEHIHSCRILVRWKQTKSRALVYLAIYFPKRTPMNMFCLKDPPGTFYNNWWEGGQFFLAGSEQGLVERP